MTAGAAPPAALAGIRVVEAATFVAGPFAGLMLADLGAEVIKVEPPSGDPGWRFGLTHGGVSALGMNVNRDKQRRHIDLKTPAGHDELDELLDGADVFLHNWRPGVAEALGVGPDELCPRFPQLVYVSISGFGPTGPRAGGPVFDSLLQGASGLADYEGSPGQPRLVRSYLADKVTATFAAQAVLAGLLARSTSGRGGHHEVSMLDAMAYFNFPDVGQHRTFLDRQPDLEAVPAPVVATADGWLVVAPVRGSQLAATARSLGHPEWVEQLKAASTPASMVTRLLELIEPVTRAMPTAECEALLADADVPVVAVLGFDEHLADEQTLHNRLYSTMQTPVGPTRRVRHPLDRRDER